MARKGKPQESESLPIAAQNNNIKTMSKQELPRRIKIADIDYAVSETKLLIT